MNAMDTDLVDDIDDDEDEDDRDKRSFTKELWFLGVVALTLALLLKAFFVQAFFIPSGSMERTLHGCSGCKGDRVLVNKLVYRFRDIHRGEVVVFNGKGTNFTAESPAPPPAKNVVDKVLREVKGLVGFGAPGDKDFIKRVIGIPGDVVACCTDGKVTVNGQPLYEPYVWLDQSVNPTLPAQKPFEPKKPDDLPKGCRPALEPCTPGLDEFGPVKVPPGQLFLMGDHRDGSSDSRAHGPVPESKVVGRAFAVFFPRGRMKVLRVPATFDPTKHPQSRGEPLDPVTVPQALVLAAVLPVTLVRRRVRRRTD